MFFFSSIVILILEKSEVDSCLDNSSFLVLKSETWILLIISAGKFFKAITPSLSKKAFPLTKNCVTSFPFTVIFPSLSISKPGNCFNNNSTFASGRTLKEEALNSKVSFFILIGTSFKITISSNANLLFNKYNLPKSLFSKSPVCSSTKG